MEALVDEVGGTTAKLEKTATDEHAAFRHTVRVRHSRKYPPMNSVSTNSEARASRQLTADLVKAIVEAVAKDT